MQELDPTTYRHFLVQGNLIVHGKTVEVFLPSHADDLPEGEDGKTEITERVRKHLAEQLGDPAAYWQQVEIREFAPPPTMYQLLEGSL